MSLARASLAELSGFIEGLAGVQGNQPARQDFLREVRLRARRIREIGWNIAVLAACTGSQDARDPLAKQLASRARALNADLFKTLAPIEDLMLGLPEAEFDRLFAVNMKAIYLAMREAVPRFKAKPAGGIRGVVLNMASTAGVSPRPRLSWYNASKGWVITATRANAVELAPFGIRVVALNPVAGETPMLKTFMGEDTPEMRAKFLSTIPIGRFSTPEDLGNAACFLCSDEAAMITGVGNRRNDPLPSHASVAGCPSITVISPQSRGSGDSNCSMWLSSRGPPARRCLRETIQPA